jgi:CheY-like chemotaxis protein
MSAEHACEVLLVEDNEDHAELIRRGFETVEIRTKLRHVTDGEVALDYLLRRGDYIDPATSPKPALILLDLRLPRVGGLEVLTRVRAEDGISGIPVVVLTTSNAEKDIAKAYELKANAYVRKPIDFSNFADLMRDLGCLDDH